MKIKTTVAEGTPIDFVRAVAYIRQTIVDEIVIPFFHSPDFGPAECFVQKPDFSDPSGGYHCNPEISRISRNDNRAENDFRRARDKAVEIYTRLIKLHFRKGVRVQLFVTLMLDSQPSLLESEPVWVEGEAEEQSEGVSEWKHPGS